MSDADLSINNNSQITGHEDFQNLLKLQFADSELDALLRDKEHLPAAASMQDIQLRAAALKPELEQTTNEYNTLMGKQSAIEAEVEGIIQRIASINERLYDGSANLAPRDAQAMSEEVKHLESRRHDLEDEDLNVMEAIEPVKAKLDQYQTVGRELATMMREATEQLSQQTADLDQKIAVATQGRDQVRNQVPQVLLSEYDVLRKNDGLAVAELSGNTCTGCHLTLSSSEVDRMRKAPATQVLHCEECGRILVRRQATVV